MVQYRRMANEYNMDAQEKPLAGRVKAAMGPKVLGGRRLFEKKNPGSPGKLGKTSTKAESLSKLRGKGALA
jgi:hypothetical protein